MNIILLIINFLGVFVLTIYILRVIKIDRDSQLYFATAVILLTLIIYLQVLILGSIGMFNRSSLSLFNLILICIYWRQMKSGVADIKSALQEIDKGFCQNRILYFPILVPLLIQIMIPFYEMDSLQYHLPNTFNFIQTGSTSTYDPVSMYRPETLEAYYMKGMEAIYAFFYQFGAARHSILFFKYFLWFALYFILCHVSRNKQVAAMVFCFLSSMEFVRNDLGDLKNDVFLALLITYSTVVLRYANDRRFLFLPIAAAFTLCLSIKVNALLYVVPLFLLWITNQSSERWKIMVYSTLLIVPFGCYFYFVNIIQLGSPLYPYGIFILGLKIFPGESSHILSTTILGNLDPGLVVQFLRGLVRITSPVGAIALTVFLGMAIVLNIRRVHGFRSYKGIAVEMTLMLLFLLAYLVTPFSDTNTDIPHSLIHSGLSLRMALPFLLYVSVRATMLLSTFLTIGQKRSAIVTLFVFASVFNTLWYDLICLMVKPQNAFALLSPVLLSFNNLVLAVFFLVIVIVSFVVCYYRSPVLLGLLLLSGLAIYYIQFPSNYSYNIRFKQIGRASEVFDFLEQKNLNNQDVAVHSNAFNSYFVGAVNSYLFGRARSVKYLYEPNSGEPYDILIVCAKDYYGQSNRTKRKMFQLDTIPYRGQKLLDFFDGETVGNRYKERYRDNFYIVYARVQ